MTMTDVASPRPSITVSPDSPRSPTSRGVEPSPKPALVKRISADGRSLIGSSPTAKNRKKVSFSEENDVFEATLPTKFSEDKPGTPPGSPSIKYTNSPRINSKKGNKKVADSLKSSLDLLFIEYDHIWKHLTNIPNSNENTPTVQSIGKFSFQNSGIKNVIVDNAEMMEILELQCLLKSLRYSMGDHIFGTLSKSHSIVSKSFPMANGHITTMNGHSNSNHPSPSMLSDVIHEKTVTDKQELFERISYVDYIISELQEYIKQRLEVTRQNPKLCLPRIVRLCDKYDLSDIERSVFYSAVIMLGTRTSLLLTFIHEDVFLRDTLGFMKLDNISEAEMEIFFDSERQHIKEGMVQVDEDKGVYYNLRIPRTAVQLLYGRKVKADDMLIIAQTSMEEIIASESAINLSSNANITDSGKTTLSTEVSNILSTDKLDRLHRSTSDTQTLLLTRKRGLALAVTSSTVSPIPSVLSRQISHASSKSSRRRVDITEDEAEVYMEEDHFLRPQISATEVDNQNVDALDTLIESTYNNVGFGSVLESDKLTPYPSDSQLAYLEDGFSLIGLLVRSNAARIKDDMKKEGTRLNSYYDSGDVKQSKREIQAKIALLEKRMSLRVESTKSTGGIIPRLETLSQRLGLDLLEKKIILLLIGKVISLVVRTLIDTLDTSSTRSDDNITVGQALNILCQDFQSQLANRKYFYKSSRLMKNGIISLTRGRWHLGRGDLSEQRILLDRRILDWTVGLDSEINELVEGSDLYEPKVDMSQLVLPSGHLDILLKLCSSYDHFVNLKDNTNNTNNIFNQKLSYGNSLVVLLCGKPGTGKTMTVNAIANKLGKKVLLVDFGALIGRQSDTGIDVDLRGLFREASMNNAVIFFDECESIFKSRALGGDRILNTMLTEIERYSGLVFLATNMAYELDEAMHRRITCVIEYRPPDHFMRKKIWENLLGIDLQTVVNTNKENSISNRLYKIGSDVDIDAIALKYELTGGFIKNAVLSALLSALHRSSDSPIVTQEDLIAGCRLQMRGSLIQRSFEEKTETSFGLSSIHLNAPIKRSCEQIIRFEKARAIIYGTSYTLLSNSRSQDLLRQKACIVAIVGPSGSGKNTIASAMAYELNRTIKKIHIADILSSNVMTMIHDVRLVLSDARLADAVFVIDGFEHILDDHDDTSKLHLLLSRLLTLLEDYPGLVVLICHMDSPQHLTLQRDFATKLFECIRCVYPTNDVRMNIWKTLTPKNILLNEDVSFLDLGRRFELYPASIASAITRTIAEVSLRLDQDNVFKQKDFVAAAEAEAEKMRSGNFEVISKLFT